MKPPYKKILLSIIFSVVLAFSINIYETKSKKNNAPWMTIEKKISRPIRKISPSKTIHIAGAIQKPGLYRISQNMRVYEALKLAGGITSDGNLDKVNLAANVKDGKRIFVPFLKNKRTIKKTPNLSFKKMTLKELQSLPGVGKQRAKALIRFRETKGPINQLSKLSEIKGISYEQIRGWIEKEQLRP